MRRNRFNMKYLLLLKYQCRQQHRDVTNEQPNVTMRR